MRNSIAVAFGHGYIASALPRWAVTVVVVYQTGKQQSPSNEYVRN
jgi:hypothetical protein